MICTQQDLLNHLNKKEYPKKWSSTVPLFRMLLVIVVVCATVSAVHWHNEPTREYFTTLIPPIWYMGTPGYNTYKEGGRHRHPFEESRHHPHSEGDRHRWYSEEGRHRHSYGEERRHSHHEEDSQRQLARKIICYGDFLKKFDEWDPYRRILSVTVQFEHGNRTVSCRDNGRYHHRYY
ncbi:hypothetical protein GCK32_002213 [Trichostrongylus colubriformis]|uniref:Uncharacterized protein n=1 Tax=Trichostrongylus colubriformis TaxID=6319 RepID=A0AAN8FS57_TRICO